MLNLKVLCVGKLKEPYFRDACMEYEKRLLAYAQTDITEIKETRLPENPSEKQIEDALLIEEEKIRESVPKGALLVALCVEGVQMKSVEFARRLSLWQANGASKLCFLIGGSNGLSERLKNEAHFRLSLSEMTFPHHLARVILLEQLYRAFQINTGGKYHK